tara:strand:- start:376 stop:648 length:273 start_codon:yes stop_codon:yes gene_type:complete
MNTPRTDTATFQVRSNTPIPDDVVYRSFAEQLETELAEVKSQVSDMTSALAACHEVLNSLKDDEDWPVKPALQFEVEAAFNLAQIELYGK